jgi:hypothetical protein
VKRLRLITLPSLVVRVGDPSQVRPLPPPLPPPPPAAAAGEQEEEEEGVQFPAASLSLPPSESLSLLSLSSWVSDSAPPSSSSRSPPPPVSLSLRRFCPLRTKCPVASRVHRVHHLLRLQRNSKT